MIIVRYLGKEILQALLAVTLILLFVFSCNEFVRYLNYVASGKYANWVLFRIVLLKMPILLGLLLPLGLYLGILLGYGRLCVDSEMTALFACGFSEKHFIKVTLGFALLVTIVVALLSLWVQPIMQLRSHEVLTMAKSASIMQTIMPGRFQTANGGKQVFYIQKLANNRKKMENVFVANQIKVKSTTNQQQGTLSTAPKKLWEVLSAQSGHSIVNHRLGGQYILLNNGALYKGIPGQTNYQVAHFKTYGIRIGQQVLTATPTELDSMPTSVLLPLVFKNRHIAAEIQWRISAPLSVLVLTLLALPLSMLKPRQGRFARMLPAIVLYIIYANLLFLGREWVDSGIVPPWLGMWWIHLLFILIGLVLLQRQFHMRLPLFSFIRRAE